MTFAYLRGFELLARERFQTISQLPDVPVRHFWRFIGLMGAVAVLDVLLAALCLSLFPPAEAGWATLALLLYENVVLMMGCIKVIAKFAIHIVSVARDSTWEERYVHHDLSLFSRGRGDADCCISCPLVLRASSPPLSLVQWRLDLLQ
jgi:hypothetical protein